MENFSTGVILSFCPCLSMGLHQSARYITFLEVFQFAWKQINLKVACMLICASKFWLLFVQSCLNISVINFYGENYKMNYSKFYTFLYLPEKKNYLKVAFWMFFASNMSLYFTQLSPNPGPSWAVAGYSFSFSIWSADWPIPSRIVLSGHNTGLYI